MIDGRLFLCDSDIGWMFSHEGLEGQIVEIALFTSGDFPPFEMDPLVAPLVEALRARGVRTLSSCEGHMDKEYQEKYPYVSFYEADRDLVDPIAGWEVRNIGGMVSRLRPAVVPQTQDELDELQRQLGIQTDVIKALK